jgi:hypothetical protein
LLLPANVDIVLADARSNGVAVQFRRRYH